MAIGTPTLVASAGATTTSATTASFTPTANALLLALCGARTAAAAIPTISDSLGGTWTQVHADADQETGNINSNLFYQVASGSPSAMTVTVASTGAAGTGIHVVEITGAGTDFSNFQFDYDAAGDPSVTMSAFQASSICMAFCVGNAGGSGFTQPSGYTELLDTAITTNLRLNSSYDVSSPGTAHAWTGVSTDTYCYGLEIKEASATQNITGALFTDGDTFHAATIGRGAVAITGALYTDTDTFYTSVVGRGTVTITGALYSDSDTFYGSTIAPGGVAITGSLYTDTDTFYTSVVSQAGSPQSITGALFSDTDTFPTSTVSGIYTITGALYTDTDTFYGAVVAPGGVSIAGVLVTDADTFYGSVLTQTGAQLITGSLVTDVDTFYTSTISGGVVSLPAYMFKPRGRPMIHFPYRRRVT